MEILQVKVADVFVERHVDKWRGREGKGFSHDRHHRLCVVDDVAIAGDEVDYQYHETDDEDVSHYSFENFRRKFLFLLLDLLSSLDPVNFAQQHCELDPTELTT